MIALLLTLEWIYNKTPSSLFPSSHQHLPNAALYPSFLLLSLCALSKSVIYKPPHSISSVCWAKPGLCVFLEPSACNLCTFRLRIYNISDIQRAEAVAGTSGCSSSRVPGAGCSEVRLTQTPHGQPPLLHPSTFFSFGVSSPCPSKQSPQNTPV